MKFTESTEQSANKHYWQKHVASWRESKLSQVAYCRLNDLHTKNFGYWKRKESKAEEVPLRFFPLVTADHRSIARCASALKLNIQEKRFNIEIGEDFSPIVLSRLIATLEQL